MSDQLATTEINADMKSDFSADCARIRSWMFDQALPLWASRGLDPVHGGFYETLSLDGQPNTDSMRRLRVQARQIFVFAQAHIMGWPGHDGVTPLEIVESGYEFLIHKGWLADGGGWLHLFTPQGGILDGSRDTYDHAFVLLAMAKAHEALGRHDPLTWVMRTLEFMDQELVNVPEARPWNGFLEGLPARQPRRQNPHMHYLEAMLALYQTTNDESFLERARRIIGMFRRQFFDSDKGVLYEFFEEDWSRVESEAGRLLEPGHHYEWVWLLHCYEKASGELLGEYMDLLFDFAEGHKIGPNGFAVDIVRDNGEVVKDSRRCWPQTEALRACLAMKESGRRDVDERISQLIDGLLNDYLGTKPHGLWIDQFDAAGNSMAENVPASTFYHLMGAFDEALRVLEK